MKKLLLLVLLVSACGKDGTNGVDGNSVVGPQGNDGANGTVISPIQFCPGNPVYPNVFPEVGFCIDNNIYAVYSEKGGFLTLLNPGDYLSNAVGSRCNFTVQLGCVISY